MAEVTTTPTAVAYKDEGFLNAGISASATTVTIGAIYKYPSGVKTKQGIDATSGFAEISLGNITEIISFGASSVDGTTKVTTWTDVRRGLSQTATTATFTAGTGRQWAKGARVRVIDYSAYINQTAFKDKANTFTEDQTIESGNKLLVGGASAYVWTENSGTDLKFKDGNNSEKTLSQLAALSGSDEKVKITATDTTNSYLDDALLVTAPITKTTNNGGANETLTLALDTVTVAKGGTGATSLTAYAPVFGGTTSTGVVQSGTVGTADQVLTSNGAGALPTMQDPKSTFKTVFSSGVSSTTLTNPTTNTDFDTHQYTVSANYLTASTGLEFEAIFNVTISSGGFQVKVVLGGTEIASLQGSAATGPFAVRGTIYGTAAAGASVAVKSFCRTELTAADSTHVYESNNLATNGTLLLKFQGIFSVSDGGNNATILASRVKLPSTTLF